MTPDQVRRLFDAGASLRAVMVDAGISQAAVAELAKSDQPRVAVVLAGKVGATEPAHATARRIYQAVADLLDVAVDDIVKAVHGEDAVIG